MTVEKENTKMLQVGQTTQYSPDGEHIIAALVIGVLPSGNVNVVTWFNTAAGFLRNDVPVAEVFPQASTVNGTPSF